MKLSILKFMPLLAAALIFTGCGSTGTRTEGDVAPVVESGAAQGAEGTGADTAGARQGGGFSAAELNDPQSPLYNKVIYFEYDRSDILAEYRDMVIAHGRFLAANPNMTVTVEGHADERGSREYNIGLGEHRANAVRQLLTAQGAAVSQITTVSYGEERPAAMGSDEHAWSQNRRAALVY